MLSYLQHCVLISKLINQQLLLLCTNPLDWVCLIWAKESNTCDLQSFVLTMITYEVSHSTHLHTCCPAKHLGLTHKTSEENVTFQNHKICVFLARFIPARVFLAVISPSNNFLMPQSNSHYLAENVYLHT